MYKHWETVCVSQPVMPLQQRCSQMWAFRRRNFKWNNKQATFEIYLSIEKIIINSGQHITFT